MVDRGCHCVGWDKVWCGGDVCSRVFLCVSYPGCSSHCVHPWRLVRRRAGLGT